MKRSVPSGRKGLESMKLSLDTTVVSNNRKIQFNAHPSTTGKVFLFTTIDQEEFDKLAAEGAIYEDLEDDGHGELINHD